ncbi:Aste57867_16337 [Aphanomyces stellatus]|uniref:Aste57867_16337 protein n=1 Tax=Aphanomyces stellatus TaxID=120398 RepID=A0A485L8F1_9STRA|nr:hypothetical protein As57867_016280 [Aphanomyces stellatus]VFT93113.1 Aste57867_16337 [Aphanomyces stellatus]
MVSLRWFVSSAVLLAAPSMQQSCTSIENGVDYPGNDLSGVPANAAEDCCGICAATAKCKAFSFAYGTCYLKSAKANGVPNGAVRSGVVAPPATQCPTIENDTDYDGGDFGQQPASRAEDCCALCANTPGCKVFAYAWNTCYLKNAQGARKSVAGVRAGVMGGAQVPTDCPAIENNVDYAGGDIAQQPANAAEDCCALCKATAKCQIFAYAWGTCYLKDATAKRTAKSGVRAAALKAIATSAPPPPPGQCSAPTNDIDYIGNDISSASGSSAAACCDQCQNTDGCNVYVWYQGTCYLKSAKGSPAPLAGAVASSLATFAPTCNKIEENVDYSGGDLSAVSKATAEECCDACRATTGCTLFTWSWGTCYLKSTQGPRDGTSIGARSMIVSQSPPVTTTPTPVTTAPKPVCGARQRQAWSTLSAADKELYISAVELAMERGHFKRFLTVHNDLRANKQAHGTCVFLFWHRKFIFAYENMLRSLDPKFACLTLAYWDYTQDYAKFQAKQCKMIGDCSVATQDWGGSTQGIKPKKGPMANHTQLCVNTRPLKSYPDGNCVYRGDWHKSGMPDWSIASARSSLFEQGTSILDVSNDLELGIHGDVHVNSGGILYSGFQSPMDPIFYLHHATIDMFHTIFYHCQVEGKGLDDNGQQTDASSFQGCTVKYDTGDEPVGPKTLIYMRSHENLNDENPIQVEDDPLIGQFFKDIPSEYYKLADPRPLGYSYNFAGLVGNMYSTCGSTKAMPATESVNEFAEQHTVTPIFKATNQQVVDFETKLVNQGMASGLTEPDAFKEIKKVNLMLHVNCLNGTIEDFSDEYKEAMHLVGKVKPDFALWTALQANQTSIAIPGWEATTQNFYGCDASKAMAAN